MNLIGKIFTVFVLVLAVVFAAFAAAVYSTHRNWMAETYKKDLELEEAAKAHKKELEKKDQQIKELGRDVRLQTEPLAKIQTSYTKLENENQRLVALNEKLLVERDGAITAQLGTSVQNESLEKLWKTAEENRQAAVTERDANAKEVMHQKDLVNVAEAEVARLKKQVTDLAAQYAKAKDYIIWTGGNEDSDYKATEAPPWFRGHVSEVRGNEFVEIYGGSDMGLRVGHELDVSRGGDYIGRIKVMTVHFDISVCTIMKDYLRKPMQRGDYVRPQSKSERPAAFRRPRADMFTALLLVALIALALGITALYMLMKQEYEFKFKVGQAAGSPAQVACQAQIIGMPTS